MASWEDRFDSRLQRMEDRLVRRLTISMAWMLIASASLVVGALAFATGITLALQPR